MIALAALADAIPAESSRTVAMDGLQFVPALLTVKRGDEVRWVNNDLVAHTVTLRGVFDSGTIAPGKSWSQVMQRAGRYNYVCTLHPTMKAVLVVE